MVRRRSPPTLIVPPVSEPLTASTPHSLYLLCAEVPIGRTRHYLGITRTERLAARLREHAHRRGSSLTAALAARNAYLDLVRVWPDASYELEARMKRRGHYSRLCPVCQNGDRTHAKLRVPCPDLPDLDTLPENIGLGLPLRGVQTRRG